MRNLDQIRSSICIMNLPVKIASSHAGFSYAADGVQIQALEDIAIMRSLPNMKVLVPGDAAQAAQMVGMAIDVPGPVYIRLGRAKTESIEGHKLVDTEVFSPIEFGRAQMLRRGSDATIIATGYTVMLALKAAAELAQRGIHVTVINMHTIKPIDAEEVKRAAAETRRILTIEEHQVTGGLGGAVAEVLASCGLHCKLDIMGVNDEFGRTAREESELWELKGLNISNVIAKIKALLTWYP
jgi:transketolase